MLLTLNFCLVSFFSLIWSFTIIVSLLLFKASVSRLWLMCCFYPFIIFSFVVLVTYTQLHLVTHGFLVKKNLLTCKLWQMFISWFREVCLQRVYVAASRRSICVCLCLPCPHFSVMFYFMMNPNQLVLLLMLVSYTMLYFQQLLSHNALECRHLVPSDKYNRTHLQWNNVQQTMCEQTLYNIINVVFPWNTKCWYNKHVPYLLFEFVFEHHPFCSHCWYFLAWRRWGTCAQHVCWCWTCDGKFIFAVRTFILGWHVGFRGVSFSPLYGSLVFCYLLHDQHEVLPVFSGKNKALTRWFSNGGPQIFWSPRRHF